MNRIGPTFGSELTAAGVADGVAWSEDGEVWFNDDVTQAQREAVQAVLAAHDPSKPFIEVPQSVTRYQAEVYMRRINLWDQADALFAAMDDADERKIAWLRAPTFNRESPALVYAAQQLGITDADLDQMFIDASKII